MSYVNPRRGVGHGFGRFASPYIPKGYGSLGDVSCDAGSIWSDWSSGDNAGGDRAAKAIQAGLNAIGYGPIAVDGQFGSGSIAAWNKFASDNGVAQNWPDQPGIIKLCQQVSQGGNQGGGGVQQYNVVSGQYVPVTGSAGPTSGLTQNQKIAIGVGAVALVGILALAAKKKGSSGKVETTMSKPVAVANPRRRHRRRRHYRKAA